MIFKSLHNKLLKKKIENSLIKLSNQRRFKPNPIKTLGCIVDPSFPVSVDKFIELSNSLGLKEKDFKIITFQENKNTFNVFSNMNMTPECVSFSGNLNGKDELIFEEETEAFTVSISLSSDEKYYLISTSDHNTSEQYYFGINEKKPLPKLIKKRERGVLYSVNSWNNKFYNHTNENAEDFKVDISESLETQNWETFIPAKDEVLIGGCVFLNNWIIRSEVSNALDKLFVKNISTGIEEELIITEEKVCELNISLRQKNRNTDEIYVGYSSPKTPSRVYLYNLSTKSKQLMKEQEIPSGHNPDNYIVERIEFKSHDERLVPLITREKYSYRLGLPPYLCEYLILNILS